VDRDPTEGVRFGAIAQVTAGEPVSVTLRCQPRRTRDTRTVPRGCRLGPGQEAGRPGPGIWRAREPGACRLAACRAAAAGAGHLPVDLFAALLPDLVRVLGRAHPGTLSTRHTLARWTGEAGDPAAARDQFAALLPDLVRVLGPAHPGTLSARHNLAYWTGEAERGPNTA
jgi:hypothetical protein